MRKILLFSWLISVSFSAEAAIVSLGHPEKGKGLPAKHGFLLTEIIPAPGSIHSICSFKIHRLDSKSYYAFDNELYKDFILDKIEAGNYEFIDAICFGPDGMYKADLKGRYRFKVEESMVNYLGSIVLSTDIAEKSIRIRFIDANDSLVEVANKNYGYIFSKYKLHKNLRTVEEKSEK